MFIKRAGRGENRATRKRSFLSQLQSASDLDVRESDDRTAPLSSRFTPSIPFAFPLTFLLHQLQQLFSFYVSLFTSLSIFPPICLFSLRGVWFCFLFPFYGSFSFPPVHTTFHLHSSSPSSSSASWPTSSLDPLLEHYNFVYIEVHVHASVSWWVPPRSKTEHLLHTDTQRSIKRCSVWLTALCLDLFFNSSHLDKLEKEKCRCS